MKRPLTACSPFIIASALIMTHIRAISRKKTNVTFMTSVSINLVPYIILNVYYFCDRVITPVDFVVAGESLLM